MESDSRGTPGIQRFLYTLAQFFGCCCWIGPDEREVSLSVEETSPASSYQSSVRPYFVEEESTWRPNGIVSA